jgi:hypothetical protein
MANTTWSTTDRVNATLSGTNNLTVTTTAGGGARTIDRQGAGKYYFEYTCTTVAVSCAVGVGNGIAVIAGINVTPVGTAAVGLTSGVIAVNNANTGSSLGARASGDIIGVALDDDNKLIWFRVAPSGNWNGSGTANPATGVGGLSIAAISLDSRLLPLCGWFAAVGSGDVITANFGDSAFTGAVPSGFTSGFPTGSPPLVAAVPAIARETLLANPISSAYLSALIREVLLQGGTPYVPPATAAQAAGLVMEILRQDPAPSLTKAQMSGLVVEALQAVSGVRFSASVLESLISTARVVFGGQVIESLIARNDVNFSGLANEVLEAGQRAYIGGLVKEALIDSLTISVAGSAFEVLRTNDVVPPPVVTTQQVSVSVNVG